MASEFIFLVFTWQTTLCFVFPFCFWNATSWCWFSFSSMLMFVYFIVRLSFSIIIVSYKQSPATSVCTTVPSPYSWTLNLTLCSHAGSKDAKQLPADFPEPSSLHPAPRFHRSRAGSSCTTSGGPRRRGSSSDPAIEPDERQHGVVPAGELRHRRTPAPRWRRRRASTGWAGEEEDDTLKASRRLAMLQGGHGA